jgi:hypothetical protein
MRAEGTGPGASAEVTVGETPWALVGALAAGALAGLVLMLRRRG